MNVVRILRDVRIVQFKKHGRLRASALSTDSISVFAKF